MMKKFSIFFLTVALAALISACSSTKPLLENQYMLTRNNVEVLDEKNPDFDNLKSYVRPIPNKKFMDVCSSFSCKRICKILFNSKRL